MYTSNKLFLGVIDTIPSDNNTRGHTSSLDLDWLSWGERSLRLLIWHIRSCMLCPAGANCIRNYQWQNKQRSHFFSRFGFVVLWWTMTKSSFAYMICKKLYALLCKCQQHEKWWPMTNNFSLPTPSPEIWIDCLQIAMTKFLSAGMIQYIIKSCCSALVVLYTSFWCCRVHENTTLTNNDSLLRTNIEFPPFSKIATDCL